MIDWLTIRFPYTGPPVGDMVLVRDWESGEVSPKRQQFSHVEGSYSSKLAVQVIGGEMTISGNPVKHWTGQNVVGTNDIHWLSEAMYEYILASLNLPNCIEATRAFRMGSVRISRVDCTFSYKVGTPEDAALWMRALGEVCHVKYRGKGHYDEGMNSIMFGIKVKPGFKATGSSYSSFKFYCKSTEVKKRPFACPPQFHDELHQMIHGEVRGEALYRAKELKSLNMDTVRKWTKDSARELNEKWIAKMDISKNVNLEPDDEIDLPNAIKGTYLHWKNGEDLRRLLSRPTFYRHRTALLAYDIDISVMPLERRTRVLPLLTVLEARPTNVERGEELFREIMELTCKAA